MNHINNTHSELLRLYFDGEATAPQAEELFELLLGKGNMRSVVGQLRQVYMSSQHQANIIDAEITERMQQTIMRKIQSRPQVYRPYFLRTAWCTYAAAIIILLTGAAAYFFIHNSQSRH